MRRRTQRAVLVFVCCLLIIPAVTVTTASSPTATPSHSASHTVTTTLPPTANNSTSSQNPAAGIELPDNPPDSRNWTATDTRVTAAATNTELERVLVFEGELSDERRTTLTNRSIRVGAVSNGRAVVSGHPATLQGLADLPWVLRLKAPLRPQPLTVSEGVESIDADALHEANVTGTNVTVGVIDMGFDVTNPEIADNIIAARAFDDDPFSGRHGTAVTEIVTDVAPDANVAVAQIDNGVEYDQALHWLTETQDVDVITVSLGFFGQPHDGSGPISSATTQAAKTGTVVTVAAGNVARRHWGGDPVDEDSDGLVEFNGDGIEANYLNAGTPTGGQASLYLTWNDWPTTTQDFNLYLYRVTSQEPELVAASTRSQVTGGTPREFIRARLPAGQYFTVIEGPAGTTTPELDLFCAGTACGTGFSESVPAGSITAPAVAPGVIGVGAYHVRTGELEPYSSRGPDNNGDRGVDILGPARVTTTAYDGTFAGTSAATPHVAGAATLAIDQDSTASRTDIMTRLEEGAIGMDRPPEAVGAGRVSAGGAIRAGLPPLNASIRSNSTAPYRVNSTIPFDVTTEADRSVDVTWDLNGDGAADANGTQIRHHVTEPGTHTLTATVTDDYGSTATIQTTIEVFTASTLPTTMSLTAEQRTIPVNGTTAIALRYDDGFGVDDFEVSVSTGNESTLSIENATTPGNTSLQTTASTSTLRLSGTLNQSTVAGNVTLATVTVRGNQTGITPVRIDTASVTTVDGVPYDTIQTRNASVNVQRGPGDVTGNGGLAADPDGDGVYEDVNGDGSMNILDVQALFAHRDELDSPSAFDINQNGRFDILDIQALFARL